MFSVTNEVSEGKLPNSVERSSKEFGVKRTEPLEKLRFSDHSGSNGGPERPPILHRPKGDAR